jgi:hypothetical protein
MTVGFAKVGAHERVKIQIIGAYGVAVEGEHCSPGDVVECAAGDAVYLMGRGIAQRYSAPPPVIPDPVVAPDKDDLEPEDKVGDDPTQLATARRRRREVITTPVIKSSDV